MGELNLEESSLHAWAKYDILEFMAHVCIIAQELIYPWSDYIANNNYTYIQRLICFVAI